MKQVIKVSIIWVLMLIAPAFFIHANAQQAGFNKSDYYKVMQDGNTEAVDKQLKIIETTADINKEAYSGALLMKKAGLIKGASKKLSVFKDGHRKLDAVISNDGQNAEWRFLRLIIQEHAPKILNYRSDIKKDAAFIQQNFKKLSPEVQSAVLDYRKHSDTLQTLNL